MAVFGANNETGESIHLTLNLGLNSIFSQGLEALPWEEELVF